MLRVCWNRLGIVFSARNNSHSPDYSSFGWLCSWATHDFWARRVDCHGQMRSWDQSDRKTTRGGGGGGQKVAYGLSTWLRNMVCEQWSTSQPHWSHARQMCYKPEWKLSLTLRRSNWVPFEALWEERLNLASKDVCYTSRQDEAVRFSSRWDTY